MGRVRLVRAADGGTGEYTFANVEDSFGYVVCFRPDTGTLIGYRDIGRQSFSGKIVLDLNEPYEPKPIANVNDFLAAVL